MGEPTTLDRAKFELRLAREELALLTKIAHMSDHQLAKALIEEHQAHQAHRRYMDDMGETNYCRGSYMDSLEQAAIHRLLAK